MYDPNDPSEPINFFKYCPHCGSDKFEARDARQFLCGACGFNFFVNASAAVIALVRHPDGRILLVRRDREPGAGLLDLPGGFVDPGESTEQALAREVNEELGVHLLNARYVGSSPNEYIFSKYKVRTSDMAFECQLDAIPTTASDDVRELVWTRPEDVDLSQIAFTSIRNITASYIKTLQCAEH